MTAFFRFLLLVLAGGITYGGLTVAVGADPTVAGIVAAAVGVLAAWLGPRMLRAAAEAWDS